MIPRKPGWWWILAIVLWFLAPAVAAASSWPAPDKSPSQGNRPAPSAKAAQAQLDGLRVPFIANDGRFDAQVAFYVPGAGSAFFVTQQGELVYALRRPASDQPRAKADGRRTRSEIRRNKLRGSARGWALTEMLVDGQPRLVGQDRGVTGVSDFRGNDPSRWRSGLPTYQSVGLGEVWPGVTVALQARGSRIEKIFTVQPGASVDLIRVHVKGARALSLNPDGALVARTGAGDVAFTAPVAYQERAGVRQPVTVSYRFEGRQYGFTVGAYDPALPLVIDPLLQSTFLGGDDEDLAYAIAVHPETGDVYVTGETSSFDFPGTGGGAFEDLATDFGFPTVDGFVARLNSSLTQLLQATYLGGSGSDTPVAIAIEPGSGDVYVAGRTDSIDFPVPGAAQSELAGNDDAFIARFAGDLKTLRSATYFGGIGDDEANALALHATDDDVQVYIVGTTDSILLPETDSGAQPNLDSGFGVDAFVARLTADLGAIARATYLGGSDEETGFALAIAPGGGAIYVAGETFSIDFPLVAGGAQPALNDGSGCGCVVDVYVARLTSDLTEIQQATYLGGSGEDEANALAIDHGTDAVYVVGRTFSDDFPGASGAQTELGGASDAYVARLPGSLQPPIVSTYLGGTFDDVAWAVAIHPATGEVYVAGGTLSPDFPATQGGAQELFGGCESDMFIARLTSGLDLILQSTYLGGDGCDEALSMAISPLTGDVYVAGVTEGPFPGTTNGAQATFGGFISDGVVARLTSPLTGTGPDLAITKTHVGNFSGGQIGATYTITVTNVGTAPTDGTEVTVTDSLPDSLTPTALDGSGWTCELASRRCKRSDVLDPQTSYEAITLTVDVAIDAPSLVTNTATVSGGGDVTTDNDTASDPTIVLVPDLTITKTHAGSFFQGQVGATYTITVRNVGALATDGGTPVTVTDTVPAGLTATALGGSGWDCTVATRTCTRSEALSPGLSYPDITLTVDVATNAPPSVTNTAVVSGGGDSDPANNAANDVTTILARPDLTITKTHVGTFFQGQVGAAYTITVINVGGAATNGSPVTVTDTVPAGLTPTALGGSGWSCSVVARTCTRGEELGPTGIFPPITLTVDVATIASSLLTNTVTVEGGGDVSPGNNTASDPTTIVAKPDLTITKTHAGNFFQGQVGATYTITVTNVGTVVTDGTTVTVTDTVPTGLTPTALGGSGWNCSVAARTCTRSEALGPAASYPAITLTVDVAGNASSPLTNTATVSGGGDATPGNNTASDPTTIVAKPDLTVTKTHVGNFFLGQLGAAYTITVTNVATVATDGTTVTVTDTVPAGLTPTALGGTGWSCTLATRTCTRSEALGPAASYPAITLTVDVATNALSPLTNTVTVSGGGDVTPGNNTASDLTTIGGKPDLTVTKTHVGNFSVGQVGAAYTITVTNVGTLATDGTTVTVTDTVPAGLTPTALGGTGWSCTLATRTCTRSEALGPAGSYPAITLTVDVATNASSPLTNAVTVSGGGDVTPGNNTANDLTTIGGKPDLTITKTHVGDFFHGQVGAAYTMIVTNVGTVATDGTTVTVTDAVPAGLTPTALSGSGWSCTVATRTCTRSNVLSPGASYPAITLIVDVSGNASSPLTNTVTVSGGGDVTPGNNTASDVTTIGATPDLAITKTHAGNFLHGQVGATYTITVTNVGTAATDGTTVTVTDTVPAGLTPTALGGPGWDCSVATRTCTRSEALGPVASYPAITLTVDVAGNALSPVTNTAVVSGGGDVTPGNNTAHDLTVIGAAPDLTITKTHVGDLTRGQVGAVYTMIVSNVGTTATAGTVTVTDTLPTGLTATALSGPGWSCLVGTVTCTRDDALANGSSYPAITLTVTVADHASGSLINTATVSGGGDVTAGNDTAHDPTTVVFVDVPTSHPFYRWVEGLVTAGITGGCSTSPPRYCPDGEVTRAQMAVFLLRGIHGGAYQPPAATGTVFVDVPLTHPLATWIEQLEREGITDGCSSSPSLYCPDAAVTRGQMAVFLLRAKHGAAFQPPAATGLFTDVPLNHPFADWIEELAREAISLGCGPATYCPDTVVTRDEMAVLLVRTFDLPI